MLQSTRKPAAGVQLDSKEVGCDLQDEGADVAHAVGEDDGAGEGDEDDEDALVVGDGCDVAITAY